jgi:DNA-binding GntR family transcriptional regulator
MFLVSLLENRRLTECISNLRDQIRICGAFDATPLDDLKTCAEEHGELVESVVLKDHVRAVALMTQHLEYSEAPARNPLDMGRADHSPCNGPAPEGCPWYGDPRAADLGGGHLGLG